MGRQVSFEQLTLERLVYTRGSCINMCGANVHVLAVMDNGLDIYAHNSQIYNDIVSNICYCIILNHKLGLILFATLDLAACRSHKCDYTHIYMCMYLLRGRLWNHNFRNDTNPKLPYHAFKSLH